MARSALLLTLLLGSCGGVERAVGTFADGEVRYRGWTGLADGERVSRGAWTFYHPNGEIQAEGEFEDGGVPAEADLLEAATRVPDAGRDDFWHFYDDEGRLVGEGRYEEGERDDLWVTWYENGELCCSGMYLAGELDGYHVRWDPEGRKRDERTYAEGRLTGTRRVRDAAGEVVWTGEYVDGELLSSEPAGVAAPPVHDLPACLVTAELGTSRPVEAYVAAEPEGR